MEDKRAEEDRLIQPYKEQISSLRSDVTRLDGLLTTSTERHEKEVSELRAEHLECVKNHAALEATVKHLESEVRNLRDWRHEQTGKLNVAILNAEAQSREG